MSPWFLFTVYLWLFHAGIPTRAETSAGCYDFSSVAVVKACKSCDGPKRSQCTEGECAEGYVDFKKIQGTCSPKKCKCDHGVGEEGLKCAKGTLCSKCNKGYYLVDGKCTPCPQKDDKNRCIACNKYGECTEMKCQSGWYQSWEGTWGAGFASCQNKNTCPVDGCGGSDKDNNKCFSLHSGDYLCDCAEGYKGGFPNPNDPCIQEKGYLCAPTKGIYPCGGKPEAGFKCVQKDEDDFYTCECPSGWKKFTEKKGEVCKNPTIEVLIGPVNASFLESYTPKLAYSFTPAEGDYTEAEKIMGGDYTHLLGTTINGTSATVKMVNNKNSKPPTLNITVHVYTDEDMKKEPDPATVKKVTSTIGSTLPPGAPYLIVYMREPADNVTSATTDDPDSDVLTLVAVLLPIVVIMLIIGVVIVVIVCRQVNNLQSVMPSDKEKAEEKRINAANTKQVAEANLAKFMAYEDVHGLSKMPEHWRKELVPKHMDGGDSLMKRLVEMEHELKTDKATNLSRQIDEESKTAFKELVQGEARPFFEELVKMYASALGWNAKDAKGAGNEELIDQIINLLIHMDDMYRDGYENTWEVWVRTGDQEALAAWEEWAQPKQEELKNEFGKISQITDDLFTCYAQALEVYAHYNTVMEAIANETGGKFQRAPIKHLFRMLEKTALRHDPNQRFKCDNVYDVVRGALVYKRMAGCLRGAKAICDPKSGFFAVRMKDRYSNPTSARWRDALINGYVVLPGSSIHLPGSPKVDSHQKQYKVEVQIHHEKMKLVRSEMGGHHIYGIYRSLLEALEVTMGEDAFVARMKLITNLKKRSAVMVSASKTSRKVAFSLPGPSSRAPEN